MTTYYVGPGGSDASNGLSWANRKLTLTGVEDIPVAAGDTVYVGPGVYRETLRIDIAGSAGNPITYIGDVTGENTDGIGGVVRISGSDNDQSLTRVSAIDTFAARNYRTFRGFLIDGCSGRTILLQASITNIIIEDCVIYSGNGTNDAAVYFNGATSDCTIRRCVIISYNSAYGVEFLHTSVVNDTSHLVENCLFIAAGNGRCVMDTRVGGITIKNCASISGGSNFVRIVTALDTGQTVTVNNCIINGSTTALQATVTGELVEDYNTFFGNGTDYNNVTPGSNSQSYPPLFNSPLLIDGYKFPWWAGELSEWSPVAAIAGTGEATDDLFGMTRPTTSAKKSWGPIQFVDTERETGTTRTGSVAIVMHDAGRHQMFVPVTNTSTTFSVYVHREANYAGTNPQMIIKQPGVADDTTTDAAAASQWNELTTTLTPSANTDFVVVELVSNNTATSGSYDVFFDDFTVS